MIEKTQGADVPLSEHVSLASTIAPIAMPTPLTAPSTPRSAPLGAKSAAPAFKGCKRKQLVLKVVPAEPQPKKTRRGFKHWGLKKDKPSKTHDSSRPTIGMSNYNIILILFQCCAHAKLVNAFCRDN